MSEELVARIASELRDPARAHWFRAPGRVNLMGDHTDYNEGFVLPMAIQLECVVAATPTADERVRVRSLDERGELEVPADGSAKPRDVDPPWGRYPAGLVRALAARGRPAVGLDAVVASTVPVGSGLSSSAALEVALALALATTAGLQLSPRDLALACQEAEHLATGVPSGIMDQLCSASGVQGHALLIDCRTLDVTPVPAAADFVGLVVHSGTPRTLERSAYAERRAACERIAARLGLRALRDATLAQVQDEPLARHVVRENLRVDEAADALARGDLEHLGELFRESHASLRDDYRVSTPELDALTASLEAAGALGARLTGAGFGGCVVAVAPPGRVDAIAADGAARYRRATGLRPTVFLCRPSRGAGPWGA